MIRMPWSNSLCPSVMLEITDKCNIRCQVCYKKLGTSVKSLSQIQQDLETAMKLRRLHTVTISGGEPTLHPELCQIVAMIKRYGFHVFLLTNGILIDENYLRTLKQSGLDSILFHVDLGQRRPDLPRAATFNDVQGRLNTLTRMASSYGLDVSISVTLYDDNGTALAEFSKFFFESSHITFLFLARAIDPHKLVFKLADARRQTDAAPAENIETNGMRRIIDFYQHTYGIEPFSFIPTTDGARTVWISYFVPIIYSQMGNSIFPIRPNPVDSWLMEVPRIVSGAYIHKTKQNALMTLVRVLVNSLCTLRLYSFAWFFLSSLLPSHRLRHKIIVYDDGPIAEGGGLVHCEYCPTAIIRDGKLLPCCTADYGCEFSTVGENGHGR